MAVDTSQFRNGLKIELDGEPYSIVFFQHVKPGKGGAFVRTKVRNLKNGKVLERRFRAGERVDLADVEERRMQYLYPHGDQLVFMDNESYEQLSVNRDMIGEPADFLLEGMICTIQLHDGVPLSVTLPQTVTMRVTEADPVVKGQTASSSYKPGKLENGRRVMLPPHIGQGTRIVVNTADGSYVERAK